MRGRSPARLLAPTALVTTALALFLILATGNGDQDGASGGRAPEGGSARPTATGGTPTAGRRERRTPRTYTVKPGDTPSAIAEDVGIPLEDLLDLNPEVDPQSLSPGQRLRLR